MRKNTLPVRSDVTEAEYHRNPTAGEIKFGYGATVYMDFPVEECTHSDGTLKCWLLNKEDGLRYYR